MQQVTQRDFIQGKMEQPFPTGIVDLSAQNAPACVVIAESCSAKTGMKMGMAGLVAVTHSLFGMWLHPGLSHPPPPITLWVLATE